MLESRNHSESGVKTEEFVVKKFLWLGALNLNWFGDIGESPLHGLW